MKVLSKNRISKWILFKLVIVDDKIKNLNGKIMNFEMKVTQKGKQGARNNEQL